MVPWLSDNVSSGSIPDLCLIDKSYLIHLQSFGFSHGFTKLASVPLALLSLRDLTIYVVFISPMGSVRCESGRLYHGCGAAHIASVRPLLGHALSFSSLLESPTGIQHISNRERRGTLVGGTQPLGPGQPGKSVGRLGERVSVNIG